MGATIALPFLEAIPEVRLRAGGASARQTRPPIRLVCIEMVHGAAGSSPFGVQQNLWAPAATGRTFDLSGTSLKPLEGRLGAGDRVRLADYLDNVREIERRIQAVEKRNGAGDPRELPAAPQGVPDSFAGHVKLMFDLQMLAFRSDVTRVFSFKLGRDGSNRVYPESGSTGAFHIVSHHAENPDRVREFAKINAYHVGMLPYFLKQLKETPAW